MNAMKGIFACFMAFCLSLITWAISPEITLAQTLPVFTLEGSHPLLAVSTGVPLKTLSQPDFDSGLKIDFDEFPDDTISPIYSPAAYDANDSAPTVTFRAFFAGQDYSEDSEQDCNDAAELGCVTGNPSSPLSLATPAYVRIARISSDSQASMERALITQDNAAYSILFDKDVAAVGVSVLNLNTVGTVAVKFFDRQGTLLKQVTNQKTGNEYIGFGTNDDTDRIAGVQLSLVNPEVGGYKIGDFSFIQKAYQANLQLKTVTDSYQILNGLHLVDTDTFKTATGYITFKENSSDLWTVKYEPKDYGAESQAPTITFRAFFEGQVYSEDHSSDCGFSSELGCIVNTPSSPLSLADNPVVRSARTKQESTASDGYVLDTEDHAAYSALFDKDIASIGVRVLGFDSVGNTLIKVYDREGQLLGQVSNHRRGDEFFGFATDDGQNKIAGLQVSMIDEEFDGYLLGDMTFIQTVTSTNQPPVANPTSISESATEGVKYDRKLDGFFSDPDNDKLRYDFGSGSFPNWLTIDSNTGELIGIPPASAAGQTFKFKVTADDGQGNKPAELSVTITVKAANQPPVANPTSISESATEDVKYALKLDGYFSDPDRDTLRYDFGSGSFPSWLSIDSNTGELSGTPPANAAGQTFKFKVTADDGQGNGVAELSVTLDIKAAIPQCGKNLVLNGGFEEPMVYFGFEKNIPGWQLLQGSEIEIDSPFVNPPGFEGQQFVELDANRETVKISQEIPTEVGKKYKLSFAFKANSPTQNILNVRWGNKNVLNLEKTEKDTAWQTYTDDKLEATTTSTTLSFDNLNEELDGYGFHIDAVKVQLCQ
ncbi:MAG: putative Ig domain-containing protein [Microcoleaceae cyanobacterium]